VGVAKAEKVQEVQEIVGRFNDAQSALLTEYRGLTVGEIAEVRAALRDANAEYRVLKNTLARIAVRDVGLEELVEMLTGPTAIAFIRGDAVEAAKALDDAAKKYPVLVIKGGVLDGKIVDADQARALAKLESREIQLTKIAMLMNAPLQQTVNVFAAMLRDLGSMLAQVLAQKEEDAPAAEAPAPAEAEAPDAEAEAEAPAEEPAAPEAEEQAAAAPEAEEATQPEATAEETEPEAEAAESEEGSEKEEE
jgi:large subunit ribosomal protein L10